MDNEKEKKQAFDLMSIISEADRTWFAFDKDGARTHEFGVPTIKFVDLSSIDDAACFISLIEMEKIDSLGTVKSIESITKIDIEIIEAIATPADVSKPAESKKLGLKQLLHGSKYRIFLSDKVVFVGEYQETDEDSKAKSEASGEKEAEMPQYIHFKSGSFIVIVNTEVSSIHGEYTGV